MTHTDRADSWLQTITEVAAFACKVDTLEAWRAVASAAGALLETAETLAAVAESKQRARELAQTAEEAERTAQKAAKAAAEATDYVLQLEAAVAESKQTARELAQTAEEAERSAQKAAKAAAEATDYVVNLQAAMAQASTANSAAAWGEARRAVVSTRTIGATTAGGSEPASGGEGSSAYVYGERPPRPTLASLSPPTTKESVESDQLVASYPDIEPEPMAVSSPATAGLVSTIRVLYVCSGNIFRSPIAMAYTVSAARHRGLDIDVGSAGTVPGKRLIPEEVLRVLGDLDIDMTDHVSQPLTAELVSAADLVVGMATEHVREPVALVPNSWPRAFTLRELVRRGACVGPRRPEQLLSEWLAAVHLGRNQTDLLGVHPQQDVADPVGAPWPVLGHIADEIHRLVDELLDLLFL